MLPYATIHDAEAALGRSLSNAETVWFNYSATKSDYILYCHNIIFLFIIFSLFPFYYLFLEYFFTNSVAPFKIQPKVKLSFSDTLHCYKSVMRMFFLVVGPLQLVSYPSILIIGIRTGLPLPSLWEIALQLGVYFLVEDYTNYWVHRFLHCKWGYEKIHKVHHEYTAPIGFAAPYAHWAEILILGIPSFLGPAMVPGHMITFWLWIALRQIEAIETHSGIIVNQMKLITSSFHCRGEAVSIKFLERSCVQMEKEWKDVVCLSYECWLGFSTYLLISFRKYILLRYDFPWTPTKYIPFYGGPDYHDYHHYVGGQSQSNFASVFTYCDYIYGTDKKVLLQLREGLKTKNGQNGRLHDQFAQSHKEE
ncbi:methylsterol monooxygenase 1-1-like isoform X3 [Salvia hispanica]|uniref:methylsterol monooxygenase 1-1-like isoform X3 n=1 Tax=Salvia hispanica TaxID=49212 RepID=UPI002009124A|nr:methylsterol monooxygenase 1-1-like isoform X3 [Salvia hispanica]